MRLYTFCRSCKVRRTDLRWHFELLWLNHRLLLEREPLATVEVTTRLCFKVRISVAKGSWANKRVNTCSYQRQHSCKVEVLNGMTPRTRRNSKAGTTRTRFSRLEHGRRADHADPENHLISGVSRR